MSNSIRRTIWINNNDPSEVITSEKEKELYIKNQVEKSCGEDNFFEWLDNNFCACQIYRMSAEELKDLEAEFERVCEENAKRYLDKERQYFEQDWTLVEIEIEV